MNSRYRNKYLPGGIVRYWSPYFQSWQQALRVPDRELAAMSKGQRTRVEKHTVGVDRWPPAPKRGYLHG